MTNIANPLTGTKVDGSTFLAAECNPMGAGLVRALVNDGQSDLVASSSISGGTNKSFGFVALTTFGVTTSGAQSYSAASYTLTATGAVVINADDYTLDAGGDVVLDAGLDFDLVAGQDITFLPGGTWGGLAAKAFFSGTGWPGLGTRNLPKARPPCSFANGEVNASGLPIFRWSSDGSRLGLAQPREQVALSSPAVFVFSAPPGAVLRGCDLRFRGYGTSSTIPATRPSISLLTVAADGAFTSLGSATDAAVNYAAYSAYHSIAVALGAPVTLADNTLVVVSLRGASGANWDTSTEQFQFPTLDLDVSMVRSF